MQLFIPEFRKLLQIVIFCVSLFDTEIFKAEQGEFKATWYKSIITKQKILHQYELDMCERQFKVVTERKQIHWVANIFIFFQTLPILF